jgi:hypothetical protein
VAARHLHRSLRMPSEGAVTMASFLARTTAATSSLGTPVAMPRAFKSADEQRPRAAVGRRDASLAAARPRSRQCPRSQSAAPLAYASLSLLLARLALMMRISSSSPDPLKVYATTRTRPVGDRPRRRNRSSPSECFRYGPSNASGSANTVAASSKETPCLRTWSRAFPASHSNW